MIRHCFHTALLAITALSLPLAPAWAQSNGQTREDARLINATQVLQELRGSPDQNVPTWLLQRAYGIAVIPDVLKAAFVFGGRHGDGVLSVRNAAGTFSEPVFISLTGGSVGWQVGANSTDVVLVFVTPRSVQNFARGQFTLGADASVAAGPVGRQGEAEAGVHAEIYSYSRSRGLFLGVALDGTVLAFDRNANREFYGNDAVTTDLITSGKVTTRSPAARHFLDLILQSAGSGTPAPAASVSTATSTSAPATSPPPASTAPASNATRSYPLSDPSPGGEPK
jgi:lipid-binding SYLF domain-containing protein